MNQTNHFFDLGYGWLCKHCSALDAEFKQQLATDRSSHHSETKGQLALARWTDASRQALSCPRCGIEEMISRF
jgi:hypothetical protein